MAPKRVPPTRVFAHVVPRASFNDVRSSAKRTHHISSVPLCEIKRLTIELPVAPDLGDLAPPATAKLTPPAFQRSILPIGEGHLTPPGLSAPLAVAPRLQTPIAPPLPLPPPSSPSPPPHSAPLLPPSTVTSSSSLTSASAYLITIFLSCMSFPISPSHSSSSFFPFPSSLFFLLCSPPPPHPLGRGACHEPELRGQPCSWQQQRPWR